MVGGEALRLRVDEWFRQWKVIGSGTAALGRDRIVGTCVGNGVGVGETRRSIRFALERTSTLVCAGPIFGSGGLKKRGVERWFGKDGGCGGIGCGGTGDIGRETFLCLAALLAGCVGLGVGLAGSGDRQEDLGRVRWGTCC